MPYNEKEYNGYLIDQLRLLKRIEAVTKENLLNKSCIRIRL